MGNPQIDTGNFFETTFLLDIQIQKNSGHITYFSDKGNVHTLVTIDTVTLLSIDVTL